jgi:predicted lipid-binding transport protein (Tim44 family)
MFEKMANSQLLEIILLAAVAGVILFRLYTTLGKRTGSEQPPEYHVTGRDTGEAVATGDKARPAQPAVLERPSDPVLSGLFDISLAERDFDQDKFLAGARAAYEMIETAFAEGDRATLRPLLDIDVYAAFEAAIAQREAHNQKGVFTFVGFKEVKIVGARLKDRRAEIGVSFLAQCISAVLDADGKVVNGNDKTVCEVSDVWTFSREVGARDPNWTLIATAGQE